MPSPAVYRSPRAAATAATVLLAVSAATTVFSLAANIHLFGAAGDLVPESYLVDNAVLADAEHLSQSEATIHLLVLLCSAATFITWFHRVRVNAEVFDPYGHRRGRGWAIGAWFTPVVVVWFPRQIARDTWQASVRPDESGVRAPLSPTLLNLWWGTWWAAKLLGQMGSRLSADAFQAYAYQQAIGCLIASDLLELAAAGFAITLVRRLTAMQEQRFAEAAARAYGVPVATVHG
ncbi:DUF4328 domain-containing protein [Kitasatospora cinereorecta]|uniref:DUF4328 domain-containing protein n=1 Tax=Kitasatospora cinereorecta TaxID=285560 RepID=A0ABW0V9K1_9ACTN